MEFESGRERGEGTAGREVEGRGGRDRDRDGTGRLQGGHSILYSLSILDTTAAPTCIAFDPKLSELCV